MTAYSYFATGVFLHRTHLTSLVILVAVLLTTLITGAFCGWICPFGAVQEWLRRLARKVRFLRRLRLPDGLDRPLRYGRFIVLFLVLHVTLTQGYLVFERYDPFKNLFGFQVWGSWPWTLLVLTIVLSLFLDRWFCKYLCPLSPILEPLMALSPFHIQKMEATCTSCGKCERTCVVPRSLGPGSEGQIARNYCTRCLDCLDDCPIPDTLHLCLGGMPKPKRKVHAKTEAGQA